MIEATPPATRIDPPRVQDERPMLESYLDFHRETLLWKCAGLSDEQLKRAAVPPSRLSLLGLVRHLTEVERGWFHEHAGLDDAPLYYTDAEPDADLFPLDDADVAADFARYREAVESCRAAVAGLPLDEVRRRTRGHEVTLRWIYCHMIEEYARHNGHADLLREVLDGTTGE